MSGSDPHKPTRAEVVNEASAWLVGGGIVTMALAPLALPFLLLTVVFTLPLLLIPLVPVLLVALVALPVVAVARLVRRMRRPKIGAPSWPSPTVPRN